MTRICRLLDHRFGLDVSHWLRPAFTAGRAWDELPKELHKPLTVALDAVRHTLDAFPRMRAALDLPGVILLHRPDLYCASALLTAWLGFLDELFPSIQSFMTFPAESRRLMPQGICQNELPLPAPQTTATDRPAPIPPLPLRLFKLLHHTSPCFCHA
ncbi:hypothetical protein [Desulfoferrobacter suflitae]|uniref:hypothetical protein n=1 Tax=Desulfoferrobacter suflitae TaxID=2865782 RepID=UPI0021645847|nr:hypothetical protein [Desulfoferrobacter suflitae]MCK8600521.1 hypothetical protein [Desulfoferrobacter suflitae]